MAGAKPQARVTALVALMQIRKLGCTYVNKKVPLSYTEKRTG
ncbi:hypothetical protein [Aneurinibacillus terranovensis]